MHGPDPEPGAVHVWTEKDIRKQAVAIPIFPLGGLALIWLGTSRCVDYPFSRSPQTFRSGLIPIAGGALLIVLAGFGVRRRLRETKRSHETTA